MDYGYKTDTGMVREVNEDRYLYVKEDEFPIVIRTYKAEDKIKLKEGSKKISRLFIDKKVPMSERKMIPIIENKDKEIIFVYKLYRKYGLKYVKNNLFMVKW